MQFQKFELIHYPLIRPFFDDLPWNHSVFAPAVIAAWRSEDGSDVYFAIEKETLFMAAKSEQNPELNYLALPLPTDDYPPAALKFLAERLGFPGYALVPSGYLTKYGREEAARYFRISEQPLLEDYVYRTEDLANLKGTKYAKKRNLIRQFETAYVETGRATVERIGPDIIPECLSFLDGWYDSRKRDEDYDHVDEDDRTAAFTVIGEFFHLELDGLVVRIDSKVVAIGTLAHLNATTGVLNLEMADRGYKGIYQFLDRECARRLFAGRYQYINKESDMGVPGLCQSKRSYHPVRRIKCFQFW